MKTAKIASKEYLFIEVPNDASDIRYFSKSNKIGFFSNTIFAQNYRKLVDGNYKIITTTNKMTEQVAETIIVKQIFTIGHSFALESFNSLMDSLQLDRTKNYLLLEKLA